MSFWFVDRLLPGVVSGLVFALPVWVSHFWLRSHVTKTAEGQDRHLDELAARHDAAHSGREPQNPGGT